MFPFVDVVVIQIPEPDKPFASGTPIKKLRAKASVE